MMMDAINDISENYYEYDGNVGGMIPRSCFKSNCPGIIPSFFDLPEQAQPCH